MTTTLGLPDGKCGGICMEAMFKALVAMAGLGQAGCCRLMGRGVGGYHRLMAAFRFLMLPIFAAILFAGFAVDEARAQNRETPYWATLRFDEVNMRVGPSGEYKIEWVYNRKGMPVKVVRVREGWRLVQDFEGTQGWIASSQLSASLGVLVTGDGLADIRADGDNSSALRWRAEPGVVGALIKCSDDWCEIDVAGRRGWVEQDRLWGADELQSAP